MHFLVVLLSGWSMMLYEVWLEGITLDKQVETKW